MPAYAMAYLTDVDLNDEVREYLDRIDETLHPFQGRFVVHGSMPEVLEGHLDGPVVLIEFPDLDRARAWYESPDYQAILPLRTRNSRSVAALLPGVRPGYRASSYVGQFVDPSPNR
jgi:uncharacterized protein (DUF1330 family)